MGPGLQVYICRISVAGPHASALDIVREVGYWTLPFTYPTTSQTVLPRETGQITGLISAYQAKGDNKASPDT